jgi:uncharacterized protein YndB with AHSA1/START domain
MHGGCDCGAVRYTMTSAPLVVHACHCRWCQRESGSAFALNAMIEADRLVAGGTSAPEAVRTPSDSGAGQQVLRCPQCRVALWSHYGGSGPAVAFVRVGTLDDPDALPPDIHIFTASRQPWLQLPPGARAVPEYYERAAVWSADSLARRAALLPRIEAWQAGQAACRLDHERRIAAPHEAVFAAFADPQRLARWWGPDGFSSRFATFEPRPGGRWVFTMHGPDGQDFANECVFLEWRAPGRVVIEHLGGMHHFVLTVLLHDEDDGRATRVTWRQQFDDAAHCAQMAPFVRPANEQNLARLEAEVSSAFASG